MADEYFSRLQDGRFRALTTQYDLAKKVTLSNAIEKTVTGTIQAKIDEFKGQVLQGACKISVPAGSYNEKLTFNEITGTYLLIEGDTRSLAAFTWISGVTIEYSDISKTGSGTGTCTLAGNSGQANVTITGSTTNPDFTGWTSADRAFIGHSDGSFSMYGISSVAANVITLDTNLSVDVNSNSCLTLVPNRELYYNDIVVDLFYFPTIYVHLKGFYIRAGTGPKPIVEVAGPNRLEIEHCFVDGYSYNNETGIRSRDSSFVWCHYPVTIARCYWGIFVTRCATIEFYGSSVLKCDPRGIVQAETGIIIGNECRVFRCVGGIESARVGEVFCNDAWVRYCTTGYIAQRYGMIHGEGINAKVAGNTLDFTPATSDVQGNIYGLIYRT